MVESAQFWWVAERSGYYWFVSIPIHPCAMVSPGWLKVTTKQSHNAALSSSARKTAWTITSRRNWPSASASSLENQPAQSCISIQLWMLVVRTEVKTTRLVSFLRYRAERSLQASLIRVRRSRVEKRDGTRILPLSRFQVTTQCWDWRSCQAREEVSSPFFSVLSENCDSKSLVEQDTLWASGYELYDRISTPYQKFLETLTATYAQPLFAESAKRHGFKLYTETRGSPENVGEDMKAVHPVIRTNPVTGWKSVFAVGTHVQQINDLTPLESKALLEWFVRLVVDNHDLQVRHRWQNKNDLAIWDNRSVYHAATPDYHGLGERAGHRAVSLGEKPYLDPASKSRQEVLLESSS